MPVLTAPGDTVYLVVMTTRTKPTNFREVMNLYPSRAACARAFRVKKVDSLRKMYVRGSIPTKYFPSVVEALKRDHGIKMTLADLHAMRAELFGEMEDLGDESVAA